MLADLSLRWRDYDRSIRFPNGVGGAQLSSAQAQPARHNRKPRSHNEANGADPAIDQERR